MAMVQLVTDNFTRANEDPLSDGGNWTVAPTRLAPKIVSNIAVPHVAGGAQESQVYWSGTIVQSGDSWPADQYSEGTLSASFVKAQQFTNVAVVRQSASVDTFYFVQASTGTTYSLNRTVAGTVTQIGTNISTTPTVGDVVRLSVTGTTLTVSVNGSTVRTDTDANIASGSPGFGVYTNGGQTLADSSLSLWAAGANQAAIPTFSPVAGTYSGTQTVTITSSSGGTIFYTTDGSTPTHSSSSIASGATISVAATETVKAFASVSNFADSTLGSAAYVINSLSVSSVVVNGNSNVTAGTTFNVVVTMTTNVSQDTGVSIATTAGEALSGTTTGTITSGTNTVTFSGLSLVVAATGKLIAASRTSGDTFSTANSSAFNVVANTVSRADTTAQGSPVRNVGFSVLVTSTDGFDNTQTVSQDTVVALTLGAGTGVLSGTLTGTITSGSSSVTISGVVYNKSESGVTVIATSTSGDSIGPLGVHNAFTVGGTVATPTFSPVAGSYVGTTNVTVLDTDSGVAGFAMYYTTDGSTPTTGSTPYTGPISVAASETIKVLATATSMTNSAVGSAAYTISAAPASGSWTQGYRNFINKR